MKKRKAIITLAMALTVSQATCILAANSPGTGPVIVGGGSDGSSYDIGEKVDQIKGGTSSGSTVTSSGQRNNAVGIAVGQTAGEHAVETNSRGQAVIGDTALEFVQGPNAAVAGLPEPVVNTINSINSGKPLSEAVPGLDLAGYNALVGTHAIMTKDAATNTEKTGQVEVPLYVPNLLDGLGDVEVLFYNNMTGTWQLIKPTRVDAGSKMLWFNAPGSGTLSVVYKK